MPETKTNGDKLKAVKKKKIRKGKALKITAVVFVILILAAVLVFSNFEAIVKAFGVGGEGALGQDITDNKKFEKLTYKEQLYSDFDASVTFDANVINILVFGMDKNEAREETFSSFRPDTILVASVNLKNKTISVVSIPRDTRVTIAGRSEKDKVNACMYYGSIGKSGEDAEFAGGVKCLKNTVSNLLGIPINYYVAVDMDGVVDIVNTIGGVEFDVHTDVYYKGTLRVKKGKQVLNGSQFLAYARNRSYAMGDIGRIDVQQKLIKALFKECTSASNIMKLPKIASQVSDMVTTDLQIDQMFSLAFTLSEFSINDLKTSTIPGNFGNLSGISYWIVDRAKLKTFVKDTYGVTISIGEQEPRSDKLQKLTVSVGKSTLEIGESTSFTIKGSHADGTTKNYGASSCKISTSDAGVASVSGATITAHAPGTAKITVTNGSVKTTFSITVNDGGSL